MNKCIESMLAPLNCAELTCAERRCQRFHTGGFHPDFGLGKRQDHSSVVLLLRSLLFAILLPGTVTLFVPYLMLSRRHATPEWASWSLLAFVPLTAGASILLRAFGTLPSRAGEHWLPLIRPSSWSSTACIAMSPSPFCTSACSWLGKECYRM